MPFNFFDRFGTQKLYKKQAQKIIKRFGIPIYYVRKKENTPVDKLYGEQYGSRMVYDKAYPMKMFLESFENYDGALQFNSFLSVLDNSLKFCIDIDTFRSIVPNLDYPEEGDIIFLQFESLRDIETSEHFKALEGFYIRHCDRRSDFYKLNFFHLIPIECNRLEYNHQIFQTGVELIDSLNDIDDNTDIANSIGDNDEIDRIDKEGIEYYNPINGTMEEGSSVTNPSPCDPMQQKQNETNATKKINITGDVYNWKEFDPYGEN